MSKKKLIKGSKTQAKQIPAMFAKSMLIAGLAVFFPVYLFFVFVFVVSQATEGKILPHTYVGVVDVSNRTFEDARLVLQERVNDIHDAGILLSFEEEHFTIETTITDPANSEISYPLVTYNVDETVNILQEKQDALLPVERAIAFLFKDVAAPISDIDDEVLAAVLEKELGQYETPAQNAQIISTDGVLSLAAEEKGLAFNYEIIVSDLVSQLALLTAPSRKVQLEKDEPDIQLVEVQDMLPQAEDIVESSPYLLAYEDYLWAVEKEDVRSWLTFYHREAGAQNDSEESSVLGTFDEIAIGLSADDLEIYLEDMAQIINVDAREAKFEMQNGRVTEFQASRNGLALNIDASIIALNEAIAEGLEDPAQLVVEESTPEVSTADVNSLGITELVGFGKTDFSGSPKNRRHNISLAAEKLNGTLIAPGETFSLVKALSPIDKANGYLAELVIKGNRTIPEVGGGLCQIGTTNFRVVLDAGLPIVERRNHSYRVSYYEPPVGMDATIYDPKPDFRFTNDYASHLLLMSYVDGNELIFELYGTKDGRTATSTKPRLYNVVKPGPTKIIETTDLAPGQRKCIEHAHNGADADFTYTVEYADGRVETEVFQSHYKAWPEVCLVGVAEVSEDTEETELENIKDDDIQ
ncbi:VanW family protein [Patescibacteria group bacterium]